MSVNQGPMKSIKTAYKFIWRHIFTFYILSVIVRAAIAGNVVILSALLYLVGAVIVDWAKQFIKLIPNPNSHHSIDDQFEPLHVRQPWNSSIIGTPTNLMNIGNNRYN